MTERRTDYKLIITIAPVKNEEGADCRATFEQAGFDTAEDAAKIGQLMKASGACAGWRVAWRPPSSTSYFYHAFVDYVSDAVSSLPRLVDYDSLRNVIKRKELHVATE